MEIRSVIHRGLRRLVENDDPSGLPTGAVERIRSVLSFLEAMEHVRELYDVPGWRPHQLRGARQGVCSLSVTRNWRITFSVDAEHSEIVDLDYEDYH